MFRTLVLRQSKDEKYSKITHVENILSQKPWKKKAKQLTFRMLVLLRSDNEKYSKGTVVETIILGQTPSNKKAKH